MSVRPRIWLAVAPAFGCAAGAPSVRADVITPDSIVPPPLSPAAQGAPVAAGGLVSDQYQGLGLFFPVRQVSPAAAYSTAVGQINGQDVWTGVFQASTPNGWSSVVSFDFLSAVSAEFVKPGTTTPVLADSVTVTFETTAPASVAVLGLDGNGNVLTSAFEPAGAGETSVALPFPGVQSLFAAAVQPVVDPPVGGPIFNPAPFVWGVRSVAWDDPQQAPEPASFALAALGLLGLIGYAWRRRSMGVRLPAV